MKTSATWAVAALLTATVCIQGSGFAEEKGVAAGPGNILGALDGTAVSAADLNRQHALGTTSINIANTTVTKNEKTINSGGPW
jgi:hypothetical protein